ncbi:hypothetical protein [Nocardia arthritidis]|uniref:ESX-1 secretion-associated protein n=1 Tax=Nocardia arthritidis TaxID=228602 RepID=A0A6G9Y7Z2_9NOCA|nr:hypothetical protein [Nocardia arthritidis]QIS09186.1 hypothetical protein F5544_06375 [Nocardia arthritidis]
MTSRPVVRMEVKAVRQEANAIKNCATHYRAAADGIAHAPMQDDDLGLFARDLVGQFNAAFSVIEQKLRQSEKTVTRAGEGLDEVATLFEGMDGKGYEELTASSQKVQGSHG